MKIVLASESPRRKHLFSWFGLDFKAVSHQVNEADFITKDPEELVGQLAMVKALSASSNQRLASSLIIGSDLVVALRQAQGKKEIFGKPKDLQQAREFLKTLSGKTHIVYCAVCVALLRQPADQGKPQDKIVMSVAKSEVKMKKYDDKIIEQYIEKFAVLDKGGAYAIQFELLGYGSLVESFKGGITTIIGLPLDHLENLLKEFGVKVKSDWRKKCKIETGYEY